MAGLRELIWAPVLLAAAFMVAGAFFPDTPFLHIGRVAVLGAGTLSFVVLLAVELARGGRVEVRTYWGGLGGGLGGWRLSRAAVYLLGALVFGGLTAATGQPPLADLTVKTTVEARP